jgi:hypothetical protein
MEVDQWGDVTVIVALNVGALIWLGVAWYAAHRQRQNDASTLPPPRLE